MTRITKAGFVIF